LPISDEADLIAAASVQAALDAARDGSVDCALVPIENSVEGAVSITLDELANGEPLVIIDEAVLAVSFSLVVRPGTLLTDITRIATHPHAAAQVRGWITANIPGALILPATSTAAAAQGLLDPACGYDAAIAQHIVTELYDVESLADGIEDTP
jgi:prephenate dehydratase